LSEHRNAVTLPGVVSVRFRRFMKSKKLDLLASSIVVLIMLFANVMMAAGK
jgi:hypothetical protein